MRRSVISVIRFDVTAKLLGTWQLFILNAQNRTVGKRPLISHSMKRGALALITRQVKAKPSAPMPASDSYAARIFDSCICCTRGSPVDRLVAQSRRAEIIAVRSTG
ncbi:hypothetical protein ASG39_07200 [Rhizobium sp. Leaf371]|nr:hypothetical protein ASG39_07200 [Rhizobium sp. Leaf371]